MKSRRRPTTAFTLVEVMIALLFISIALFGYIALQMRLIDSNERILLKQQAVLKAEADLAAQIAAARAESNARLHSISSSSPWTDRSGTHEYQVDGLVQPVRAGW